MAASAEILTRGFAGFSRSPTARREAGLAIALIVVGAAFSLASPYFLTATNLITVLRNAVELSVVTAGMTLVIIMGGIDVGVGGIVAVAAIAVGRAYQAGLPDPAVIVVGLTVGLLLGLVNGFLCSRVRVPPIIATLGTMYIWIATVFLVLGGSWIAGLPSTLTPLVRGSLFGIPSAILVIGGVYLICWYVLRQTPFGRHAYAIGCNEAASRLSGINVDRVKLCAYAFLGLLAGFAAILYVARLRNVEINIGTTVALEAIAATILGGTSIRGGVGSLAGALLGVLFIKVIQNGLILIGVSSLWEPVVLGGLLIAVLALDARQHGAWRGMLSP